MLDKRVCATRFDRKLFISTDFLTKALSGSVSLQITLRHPRTHAGPRIVEFKSQLNYRKIAFCFLQLLILTTGRRISPARRGSPSLLPSAATINRVLVASALAQPPVPPAFCSRSHELKARVPFAPSPQTVCVRSLVPSFCLFLDYDAEDNLVITENRREARDAPSRRLK